MTAPVRSRLSIAFDMTFPNRNAGGSGVYARSLLSELQQRSELQLYEISGPNSGGLPGTLRWLLFGCHEETLRRGADLLHCPAFVAPWRSPIPLVITMHDAGAMRFPGDFPREWRLYNRYILPGIARKARVIITGTETSRSELARYYGISTNRIAVTHYGIDSRYHQKLDTTQVASERDRLSGGAPMLLFIGAPVSRKNLDIVLQAMSGAPPESVLSQVKLVISGASEEQFPHYRDWIAEHRLQRRVIWLGRVASDRMPLLYAASDAVVYPSFYEGFGLPPLEAMAVGTPVIASTAACLPEVLGNAALLVDPNDHRGFAEAVMAALMRPELRARMVTEGKTRAAQYTWERCAEETCNVYRTVLGLEC
ncbi:MAG: glycosyltransferase family 1 protein [Chloroflexia bacterium]